MPMRWVPALRVHMPTALTGGICGKSGGKKGTEIYNHSIATTCLGYCKGVSDANNYRLREPGEIIFFQTAAGVKKTSLDLISRGCKSYFCP